MTAPIIRRATPDDAAACAAIYAPEVLSGIASAETTPPTDAEFAARMDAVFAAGLPWLVAERDGRPLGYAYLRPYHARAGYRFTFEDGVYIAADARGQGVGKALVAALVEAAPAAGARQIIASISVESGPSASVALHAACGFREVGRMRAIITKFGRWLDVVYMQRAVGPGDGPV